MSDCPQVLISGAGPVGLALSIGLARRGVRSVVFEKNPQLNQHSRAIVCLPRTLEIFREWGLEEVFREHSEWRTQFGAVDPKGRPMIQFELSELGDISATAAAAILPQNETERLLYEEALKSGLVDVRLGHELVAFNQIEGGVRVRVRAGEDSYPIEAKYLCACDGAHSTVREDLGLSLDGKTYPAHAVLADVRIEDDRDKVSWPRVDLSKPGLHFTVRFSPNQWRLILALPGEVAEREDPSDQLIQTEIERLVGTGPVEIVWKSNFRIHCRNAAHFRVGRIMLLGDAAHLNSPAGGQGMNGGIQDAHNLGWKLAAVLRGADEERFLGSYDQERQDAIRHGIDVASDRLTRFGILSPLWLRKLGFKVVKLALRFQGLRKKVARGLGMLNHRYDASALIDESGGQLLPDIELVGDGRLRDVVGREGAMLVSRGRTLEIGGRSYELSMPLGIKGRYMVVRPDSVVAYAGKRKADADRVLQVIRVKPA